MSNLKERPSYNGVKAYDAADLAFSYQFRKGEQVLAGFDASKEYKNINEVIELYNVYLNITNEKLLEEYADKYRPFQKQLMGIVAKYFHQINDSDFVEKYNSVCFNYLDDFWALIDKFKIYKNITDETFSVFLNSSNVNVKQILYHKDIVNNYDVILADHLRSHEANNVAAELIIYQFLEKHSERDHKVYFPDALEKAEYGNILQKYVESESANANYLKLILISQSSNECPISDKLRLNAKRRLERFWTEENHPGAAILNFGIGVNFTENSEICSLKEIKPREWFITYDSNWIKDNLDYPTLLNNFIWLFGYVDSEMRSFFPANWEKFDIFEKALGVHGTKEYQTGTAFTIEDMKSTVEMQAYIKELEKYNIRLEDIYQWFFEEYLPAEFDAKGFIYNAPTAESSLLEKCRTLPSELDGILKQFSMYVEDGEIDRELFGMSSKPVIFNDIPSLVQNKYVYVKNQQIIGEENLLFSDQCTLSYTEKYGTKYSNFYLLITNEKVHISDIAEYNQRDFQYLIDRGVIYIDKNDVVHPNLYKTQILNDLYFNNRVICSSYYKKGCKEYLDKMIQEGDLYYENTLFTKPEAAYLNYMLNKSEFSNGLDLRNKYVHSTYPIDKEIQYIDYAKLMKITVLVIIKINEEFCLRERDKKGKPFRK